MILGAHKFYLGHAGIGVLFLLTNTVGLLIEVKDNTRVAVPKASRADYFVEPSSGVLVRKGTPEERRYWQERARARKEAREAAKNVVPVNETPGKRKTAVKPAEKHAGAPPVKRRDPDKKPSTPSRPRNR